MKKAVKVGLALGVVAVLGFGITQGMRNYLLGPERPYNAVILSGEKAGVARAAEEFGSLSEESRDYAFKFLSYDETVTDDAGEMYAHTINFLVLSKSTASRMAEEQMFWGKDGGSTSANAGTVPLNEISGLQNEGNLYLGTPDYIEEISVNGEMLPLTHANYAWIGYYPDIVNGLPVSEIAILEDSVYDALAEEEMQITSLLLKGRKRDLRDKKGREEMGSKVSGIAGIDLDYTYLQ